jgi:hypothetical protein
MEQYHQQKINHTQGMNSLLTLLGVEYQNNIISDMDKNDDNEISFEEFKEWFTNFLDYGAPDNETRNTKTLKKGRDEDDNKTINGYIIVSLIGKGKTSTFH